MKRLDKEHYKICLVNNHSLQKIDDLIKESFEDYCHRKNIHYNDRDVKMDDFREAYSLSIDYLFKEINEW
ncbi:MAG: hypothetical protein CM15mP83_8060 [Flavobacteriaceae bacterium]|nr:MAG: hypothetical protein CM15mP83_8060 [Flavobacteriaceae bacterium]